MEIDFKRKNQGCLFLSFDEKESKKCIVFYFSERNVYRNGERIIFSIVHCVKRKSEVNRCQNDNQRGCLKKRKF